ncbi:hypothetical protein [Streptomyces europaeiscabiei]|uniref:Uncharacterized protein n=2 Tax=Streptomyces europaeiscabiei TaxID=146819 RepID=A0ABU4NPR9_9ACTN|nr:hypothetical protein [Streptomyces europaeiscabiei]MDX2530915.1 hypothetical protein [Streptomyces europaeiscabiei]MDX2761339.1 hypothetical protein [Streptomyces europaeiscabiei]MDX2767562.1 hypothetical protein [Streptomyces europaeiscabiei]MDX3547629.1 hypothetical protein [Streptomyces europaeiscabiei]MDX3557106.1 hypothetical protein [Streptomyces europaeiscabiei]
MDEHGGHTHHTDGHPEPDAPAFHGMAVVGSGTPFLSHLPMPGAPHNEQTIMQAAFGAAHSAYRNDRKAHPEARLYTFTPEVFTLSDLYPGEAGEPPARTSFTGSLFRNHFEQPEAHPEMPVEIASGVVVEVANVVNHHKFTAADQQPEELTYLLFGKGPERFLAHWITGPFQPTSRQEFDHLMTADVQGLEVSDDQLRHGIKVTVTGRPDEPAGKLRERERAAAVAAVNGGQVTVEVEAATELYFESGELTPH